MDVITRVEKYFLFGIKLAANGLGIAAGGGFYNVPPETAAWFYF
jgi:hypothetical protein